MSKFGALAEVLDVDLLTKSFSPNSPKRDKQKRYLSLMRGLNILSYSTFGSLHTCERKFALKKLEMALNFANQTEDGIVTLESNIDFAYGKAVESGVQATLLGQDKQKIFMEMFLAWDMPLDTVHPRGYAKTFMDASIMLDKFNFIKAHLFNGWEVAYFNGKPAVELSFIIDLENGWYYAGHVDLILYHPVQGHYQVIENKTTGAKNVHPAMYKNSDQAVGYSIILDSITSNLEQTNTFEVTYLVFKTATEEIITFPFTKSRSQRAGWINTMLLDIQRINIYRSAGYWPKRGGSCFEYFKPCPYFDTCDLDFENFNPKGDFDFLSAEEVNSHDVDFRFKLSEIIETQKELI